jgi:hypothetical protein
MIMIIAIITQIKFHSPPANPIQNIWTLRNNKVFLLAIISNIRQHICFLPTLLRNVFCDQIDLSIDDYTEYL